MFSKVFAVLALGAVAVSALSAVNVDGINYSWNTGSVQCCASYQAPANYDAASIASLVGINAQDVTGQLGVQCNPITGIGAGTGANRASSPTCCQENFQNQLLGTNCTPATVGA
ncbi:hypothetical protein BJ165DRAFT_1390861 [Panaeolus papilionaceus]|nr:hypothetical protein BJ165DRAFT_1390861 [Panaeolus papilionaceus]